MLDGESSELLIKPVSVSKGRLLSSASTRKKSNQFSTGSKRRHSLRQEPPHLFGWVSSRQEGFCFFLWPTGSISHLVSPREIKEWINQVSINWRKGRSQGCKARKEGNHWHPLVQFHSSIIPVGKPYRLKAVSSQVEMSRDETKAKKKPEGCSSFRLG